VNALPQHLEPETTNWPVSLGLVAVAIVVVLAYAWLRNRKGR
jgi:hypothetical protein